MDDLSKVPADLRYIKERQRRWLVEQLKKWGHGSRSALAQHLGVRPDAITRMTNLSTHKEAREISFEELVGMGEFFGSVPPGLSAASLREHPKATPGDLAPGGSHNLVARQTTARILSDGEHKNQEIISPGAAINGEVRDLPVYGSAPSGRGAMVLGKEAVAWTVRPPSLFKVNNGYGMIVTGDSMSPEHRAGSICLVNPHLPPRPGETCIFRSAEEGLPLILRTLEKETNDLWHVRQHNPPRSLTLKKSEWKAYGVTVGNYR